MLGQSSISRGSSSTSGNRIFIYEVTGFQQNEETTQYDRQIRNSGSTFVQVPFARMNETMQRIVKLGGKIAGIYSLEQGAAAVAAAETESK
jgi:phycocyanin-associated, rod